MSALQFLYAAFLRLCAIGLLFTALVSIGAIGTAREAGLTSLDTPTDGQWMMAALIGLFLLVPWWLPRGLRRPSRVRHIAWGVILAGLSWFACSLLVTSLRALAVMRPDDISPLSPQADVAWFAGAFVAIALVSLLVTMRRGRVRAADAPARDAVVDHEDIAVIPGAPAARAAGPERFGWLSVHRALLAIYGICAAALAASYVTAMRADPSLAAANEAAGLATPIYAAAALGLVAGLSLMFTRTMPRFVHRPTRWFHFLGLGLYTSLVSVAGTGVIVGLYAGRLDDLSRVSFSPTGFLLDGRIIATPMPAITTASVLAAVGLIVSTIVVINTPVRRPIRSADPAPRPVRIVDPKVPAIGAAMKLYVAADWLVMRVLGLALLGTAYMLWQLRGAEAIGLVEALSRGLDPLIATWIYVGLGAFLALPFVMPHGIASPRHVVGGLVKAVLIVFATLILLIPLQVATVTYLPEIYHATLQATAPRLLKAIAGVAVTSALLIAFFKQLGGHQPVDYAGRPIQMLSKDELYAIRIARMGQS